MENQTSKLDNSEPRKYFRFRVFHGDRKDGGSVSKTKSIGMAYLRDGQNIFTVRLWMFNSERYYLIPDKNDSAKYLLMTREPNKNLTAKNKYFWNIVGNAKADSVHGVLELSFDLFEKPIFMNIYPEQSAFSASLADPEELIEAA